MMKKFLIKAAIVLAVFVTAMIVISKIINIDSADMTREMGNATYPVVYVRYNGMTINPMHGYAAEMEPNLMRESISPLSAGRKLYLRIQTYESAVRGISYEIRSVNGSRLIEDTEISDFTNNGGTIDLELQIKDLIETNYEYELILKLGLQSGAVARYYTRIVYPEDYYISDKLEYVMDFSTKTFDKEKAQELTTYLESNSLGDNTTFGKVNIHSSFHQITWGDLPVQRETEPKITIKEIEQRTGSFCLNYMVSITDEALKTYYNVKEYYYIRYSTDRIYLLNFERTMDQIFTDEEESYVNNKIMLGITSEAPVLKESQDGNYLTFITGDRLFCYDVTGNKMAYLFGFYDHSAMDERTLYDAHNIKVVDVDDDGNVLFLVSGYMNRGRHEGEVGMSVFYFDRELNTKEELIFIPSTTPWELILNKTSELSYYDPNGILYLKDNEKIYAVHVESKNYELIADNLYEGSYEVSSDQRHVAWMMDEGEVGSHSLVMMDLKTGDTKTINTYGNDVLSPLGFIGDDLVYGVAKQEDIDKDNMGKVLFPMYVVYIENLKEGKKMTYREENTYVTSAVVTDGNISLSRVEKDKNDKFVEILDDQIMNSGENTGSINSVQYATTENYEKITEIALRKEINAETMMHLFPKEMVLEEGRRVSIHRDNNRESFFVYGKDGLMSVTANEAVAVQRADALSGVVINEQGKYVWKKSARSKKNQIMAISGTQASENQKSVSVCLDVLLTYEGVVRNSEYMLNHGETVLSIMKDALPNKEILDLTNCSLDTVLYYVSMDIPVLVLLNDEEEDAVLLVGYNEMNTVVMNPKTGTVYKVGIMDSTEWFEKSGNQFITYIDNE